MPQTSKQINQQFQNAQTSDHWRLLDEYTRLKKTKANSHTTAYQKFLQNLQHSCELTTLKAKQLPKITYPDLPVSQQVQIIKQAISENQIIIVAGETGSGKSTQLPKICLDMGLGTKGFIGHTQPRRLAARSIANRLCEEINCQIGQAVGFKIRFSNHTHKNTYIKVMTDGILLAEIQQDKYLSQYEALIIDEAHERSLNIDFLLGHLGYILKKRPDLKIIITSATIDQSRFSKHFNAPIIEVSGRTYPVEVRYQDPLDFTEDLSQAEQVLEAIQSLNSEKPGDILVFFATEKDIHECADTLNKAQLKHTEVLLLFARLSNREQDKIFNPKGVGRRIILSTNVAETSLTVPGIRYVIDTGEVRISRYSYRTKVQRLPIEAISQASANQRAGRCGRVADGVCIRLYSKEDFLNRCQFTDPEILRTNLASVILQMEMLKLGNIEKFPFLQKPDSRFIKDGYRLLHEIKAIHQSDKHKRFQLTQLGRKIAKFPLDPRLASMLVHAEKLGALNETLIISSFLSIQDPRERPLKFQQKSDETHKQDHHKTSDFMGIINLWNRYHDETKTLSHRLKKDYCRRHFLSALRMREWRETYRQLLTLAQAQNYSLNKEAASYDNIHQALLSGLLSYIGFNYDHKEYLGARGLKFHIFPGSAQFKSTPKWICAAEIAETTKLYARTVAKIDPKWLEPISQHLTKKHYSEPYWSQKRRAVMAKLRISLYGLDIVNNRDVQYGQVEPVISRELFIRHALVYGEFTTKASFFKQNLALLQEVEALENKARKRNIVIDAQTLFEYYDELIPENIYCGISFEKWYYTLTTAQKDKLLFEKNQLMQHNASDITNNAYPDVFDFGGIKLPLSYHFDPTANDDGVTMRIPLVLLDQIDSAPCDWLVPGLLLDKITALMKALPKNIRKACVPVPHYAKAILEALDIHSKQSFKQALAKQITRITGIPLDESIWQDAEIPQHLLMRYEIIDNNKVLANGRNLIELKQQLKDTKKPILLPQKKRLKPKYYQDWQFDEIPLTRSIKQHGINLTVYPCLCVKKAGVMLDQRATLQEAEDEFRLAIRRLLQNDCQHMQKTLLDSLGNKSQLNLLFAVLKDSTWQQSLIEKVYDISFEIKEKAIPRKQEQYIQMQLQGKSKLVETTTELGQQAKTIMAHYQTLHKCLNRKNLPFDLLALYGHTQELLSSFVYKGFISDIPATYLKRIPYYIQALQNRIEKAPRNLTQDRQYQIEYQQLQNSLKQTIQTKGHHCNQDAQLIKWLLLELWISWYAQDIKTIQTVSITRLKKQIQAL